MKEIIGHAEWHEEPKLWIATSDDIWGLAAQATEFELLRAKVLPMISDLIELNKVKVEGKLVTIHFVTESTDMLRLNAVA